MSTGRRPGSGLGNTTAAAVEELLAAVLRGDKYEAELQAALLRLECGVDRCGMDPDDIVNLLARAVSALDLSVSDALAHPLDGLGDVRASLRDGRQVWFEVKAQTKKDVFAEITQADWVRDETDLLRWLALHDPEFAKRLPPTVRHALVVANPATAFGGWTRDALWIADVALLVNRRARERAGVNQFSDLSRFLAQKYLVHLTRQGVRIIRFDRIIPVAAVLAGEKVAVFIKDTNVTAVSMAFASPGPPVSGGVHFTYHVGYPKGTLGRHKLHAAALVVGPEDVEIRL